MKYSPVIRIFTIMFFTVALYLFATEAGDWTSAIDINSLASFLDMDGFAANQ